MDSHRQNPQTQQIVTEQSAESAAVQAESLDAKLREILEKICPGDAKQKERLANAMRQLLREALVGGEVLVSSTIMLGTRKDAVVTLEILVQSHL